MTLKKLSAGSGYEYLTRQVAAADSTELGSAALGDYYSAKGESPGRWTGSGLTGLAGLEPGDVVTAEQMRNLFGEGRHPVTATPLGRAYRPDAVAGFDLTFSPVKSVSALWALASPQVAKEIEAAHAAAVADALAFLERHAIFTREGTDGVRQVETRGLIAAAFTHRDSRSGDPDLHTHVAVANKVQTRSGKWLAIYGTVLHRYVVAASEAYNTALEHHLRDRLGIAFIDTRQARDKRPIREIDGVDPELCARWSSRRRAIEDRLEDLRVAFYLAQRRPPTDTEAIALAQRANLETRTAKHEPRSEAEQRATWRTEAAEVLGHVGTRLMVQEALHPAPRLRPQIPPSWLDEAARRIVAGLEDHRATWQDWHLIAEAQRQVRDLGLPADKVARVVELLVDTAKASLINLTPDIDTIGEPAMLRRSDGTSVYRHTGADHFTSQRMLNAEQRIVAAAGRPSANAPDRIDVELAVVGIELDGASLNDGQRDLVLALLSDRREVALALAPAGSGKTTAMTALAQAATSLGYQPLGLAPSAAAAAVLALALGSPTETLAKLDHTLATGGTGDLGPTTLVIIDEAGMADTPSLDRVIAACTERGALVRLIGDDRQLAAVGAGGVLRDIATTHGAVRLDEIVRFTDTVEAKASVDLRDGDRAALGFYLDHDRIHAGDEESCLQSVLASWQREQAAGRECLMLAPTRDLVSRLNRAARNARTIGQAPSTEVELSDGNRASVGDTILTRQNDRRLGLTATDWVRNGDRWEVTGVADDGALRARHLRSGLRVVLPPEYVRAHVELGYATTVHAAQGSTADVTHGIVTGREDRQLLYTMLTRGRAENHLHLVVDAASDAEPFLPGIEEQLTAVETLHRVIDRDGAAVSATSELAIATSVRAQLHEAARRYADAVTVAAPRVLGVDAAEAMESAGPGPLPWLPGIPSEMQGNPHWSAYLSARAERVGQLSEQVRQISDLPPSLGRISHLLTPDLREEVVVWRAAHRVADEDRSVLGPMPTTPADEAYSRRLLRRIDDLHPPAVRAWEERIAAAVGQPGLRSDQTLDLAYELERLRRTGVNAGQLLRRAAGSRPLPPEHPVEALAYRMQRMVRRWREVDPRLPQRGHTSPSPGLGL